MTAPLTHYECLLNIIIYRLPPKHHDKCRDYNNEDIVIWEPSPAVLQLVSLVVVGVRSDHFHASQTLDTLTVQLHQAG